MGSLLLLNGSPKAERANTLVMLAPLGEGWAAEGGEVRVLHLARKTEFAEAIAAFPDADAVVLGMPLYTDSMPSPVKDFIEALAPYRGGKGNPMLGFLIQSGFFEALHSRTLERYLAKLAGRLGSPYAGTIARGGGEAVGQMPPQANRKLFSALRALGSGLARGEAFDSESLRIAAGTERFAPPVAAALNVAFLAPVLQGFWNRQLKKNGAWEERFATPYAPR